MKRVDHPIARVTAVEPNPRRAGVLFLTVACPHCGREHHHGGYVSESPNHGHRASHCQQGSGYWIVDEREATR